MHNVPPSRRRFLITSAAGGAGLLLPWKLGVRRTRAQVLQTPLTGSAIPQWVDPLPLLSVAGGPIETIVAGADEVGLQMREFQARVMPSTFVPVAGVYAGTWVWGYRAGLLPTNPAGTYIGPLIVATRNAPTQIRYTNDLGDTASTNVVAWVDATDQTLHWADPLGSGMSNVHYDGPIPACVHVHGGEIPPVIDGGPDSWFTSDGLYHGHGYYTHPGVVTAGHEAVLRYPNTQEPAMIWFHDHVLGVTRLNVYAGLAGAYALIDPDLALPSGLHPVGLQRGASVDYLVPLVIQDRMFDVNGQLFFPNQGINPEHPYWVPEFVGDTIVVNGKVWPYLDVAPKRYRFLFVNGSNARAYEMFLANPVTKTNGPPIWQIGTDGGYLDVPVKIDPALGQKLVIMPGERADVIVDFAGLGGQTVVLRNTGRTPFPKGAPPQGSTLGQIVQFRVTQLFAGPDTSYDPASGIPLRPPMVRLVDPAAGTLAPGVTVNQTRQLTLNEVMGAGGPLEVLVNNTMWNAAIAERPNEGESEVWEIVNLTADAHPIHTHLAQFQVLSRQNFNASRYNAAYAAAFPGGGMDPMTGQPYPPGVYMPGFGPPLDYETGNPRALGGNPDISPYLQGLAKPPAPNEAGWKDTVQMFPGEVTRIAVRFAPMHKPVDDPDLSYPFDPNANGQDFVWHCHIIDHEDNEMMRPYAVNPKAGVTRSYVQGIDY